jgi:hypothetical protein
MTQHPLSQYVIAVIVVLVLINAGFYLFGGKKRSLDIARFSVGFLLGMLAMYIAVHIYSWK